LRIVVDQAGLAPVGRRNRDRRSVPARGLRAQGVVDALLARVSELPFCEHEQDGFSMGIATRPGMLLCQFCYQAAQVPGADITCAACGHPAADPDTDAIVVVKLADWLGVNCLCRSCAGLDLH
jgi:hypothetical protein